MATRLSSDLAPLNIAANKGDDSPYSPATNLSGSHRPTTMFQQAEQFADEILLNEMQRRTLFGRPITRRMAVAIVLGFLGLVAILIVIIMKAVAGGGEEYHSTKITKDEGNRRYQLFLQKLEPVSGGSITQEGTPEDRALNWLAYEDPMAIDPHVPSDLLIQRYVLAALYFATGGENWDHDHLFMSHNDICDWNHQSNDLFQGILCGSGGTVEMINMTHVKLEGTMPPEIGLLTNLQHLSLRHNNIHGRFPSSIGLLHKLTHLDVGQNQFTGLAPENVQKLTHLRVFRLDDNQFSGTIPHAYLANLAAVEEINLSFNRFSGLGSDDSSEIWDTKALKRLDLSNNMLTGELPTFLQQLESLEELDLSRNQFSSSIPSEFRLMKSLREFDISDNRVTGSIPSLFFVGGTDDSLEVFKAYSNLLVGRIPTEIGKVVNLKILSLSGNGLVGTIPTEIINLEYLQVLDIASNQLVGTIPTELSECVYLTEIDLSQNRLEDRIPSELWNLGNLEMLDLHDNFLVGAVPTTFKELRNLKTLRLSGNGLVGDFDPIFCDVGRHIWTALEADCASNDLLTCTCCTSCT